MSLTVKKTLLAALALVVIISIFVYFLINSNVLNRKDLTSLYIEVAFSNKKDNKTKIIFKRIAPVTVFLLPNRDRNVEYNVLFGLSALSRALDGKLDFKLITPNPEIQAILTGSPELEARLKRKPAKLIAVAGGIERANTLLISMSGIPDFDDRLTIHNAIRRLFPSDQYEASI